MKMVATGAFRCLTRHVTVVAVMIILRMSSIRSSVTVLAERMKHPTKTNGP